MANYGTPLFEDSPPDYAHGDTPKAVMPEPEYTEPPAIETKTALESKINWVQLVSIGFAFLATFGLQVPEEMQGEILKIVGGGSVLTGVVTIILRTWFTSKPIATRKTKGAQSPIVPSMGNLER